MSNLASQHRPVRTTARTLHEIFVEEYQGKQQYRNSLWSQLWQERWIDTINAYDALGWKIIAISKGSKRPVAQTAWATEPGLTRQQMKDFAGQGFNLAVVAGPSKLAVLDYDSKNLPAPLELAALSTPTICTPRGFAFVTSEPYSEKKFQILRKQYPGFESSRVNLLYELIPLSKTCTRDHAPEHKCDVHDYRIREWITPPSVHKTPLKFSEFVSSV